MSAYEEICKQECPDGCGANLIICRDGRRIQGISDDVRIVPHHHPKIADPFPCTAPTKDQFIERLSANITAAQERVRLLEGLLAETQEKLEVAERERDEARKLALEQQCLRIANVLTSQVPPVERQT